MASFADGDTHLAEPETGPMSDAHLVAAHCDGRKFRPLTVLPGVPRDQDQVCPACRSALTRNPAGRRRPQRNG